MAFNLRNIQLDNKTVIVRTDFNVPLHKGKILDNSRITKSIPTISYLLNNGAKVVIISHFGRPEGKIIREYSLAPLVDEMTKFTGKNRIKFGVDCIGEAALQGVSSLQKGEIILMENLRFHPEEEAGDYVFASKIASYGDIFVNDAFSCSHRNHASITSICKFLPSFAGFLLEEETLQLSKIFDTQCVSKMAILGGAKISTKIKLLANLVKKMKYIAIGGAMANNFLIAQGYNIGKSLFEPDYIEEASKIIKLAEMNNCQLILPEDVVVASSLEDNTSSKVIDMSSIKEKDIICDLGFKSCAKITNAIDEAEFVIWNGPLGAFEVKPFDLATNWIARYLAYLTRNKRLNSVIGGGDIGSAVKKIGLGEEFSYISTGGGAFLEWLEERSLPGLKALVHNHQDFLKQHQLLERTLTTNVSN